MAWQRARIYGSAGSSMLPRLASQAGLPATFLSKAQAATQWPLVIIHDSREFWGERDGNLWDIVWAQIKSCRGPAAAVPSNRSLKMPPRSTLDSICYYADVAFPNDGIVRLNTLARGCDERLWIYYSEVSGGAMDVEYSWLLGQIPMLVCRDNEGCYHQVSGEHCKAAHSSPYEAGRAWIDLDPSVLQLWNQQWENAINIALCEKWERKKRRPPNFPY